MDPNECLKEMSELADQLNQENEDSNYNYNPDVDRFFELFNAMDGWLIKGGALPESWRQAK